MRAGMGSFSGKRQSCRPKRGDELVRPASILCWSAGMTSVLKVQSTVTEVLTPLVTAGGSVLRSRFSVLSEKPPGV